jgi:hypothetical protein
MKLDRLQVIAVVVSGMLGALIVMMVGAPGVVCYVIGVLVGAANSALVVRQER